MHDFHYKANDSPRQLAIHNWELGPLLCRFKDRKQRILQAHNMVEPIMYLTTKKENNVTKFCA